MNEKQSPYGIFYPLLKGIGLIGIAIGILIAIAFIAVIIVAMIDIAIGFLT